MKVIKFIDRYLEEIIGVVCLGLMVIFVFMQVIWRYILQLGLPWTEELSRFLFLWLIWIGAAYAAKYDKHMRLDFIVKNFPPKVQFVFKAIANIIYFGFITILACYSFKLTSQIFHLGQLSSVAKVPMWIPYASVTVGTWLMVLRIIENFIFWILGKKKESSDVEEATL